MLVELNIVERCRQLRRPGVRPSKDGQMIGVHPDPARGVREPGAAANPRTPHGERARTIMSPTYRSAHRRVGSEIDTARVPCRWESTTSVSSGRQLRL